MNKQELINLISNHVHHNIEFIDDVCEIEQEIDLPEIVIYYKFTAECDTMHEDETNYTHVNEYNHKLEVTVYDTEGNEIELPFGITNEDIINELKLIV
jgi:hypothetical protein